MTLFTHTCLHSSGRNRVGKVNIELSIDLSTATPNAPPTKLLPYQCRAQRVFYFAFIISSCFILNLELSSIRFSPKFQGSHIRINFDITNMVQFDRYIQTFRLTYCLHLRGFKLHVKLTMLGEQSPTQYTCWTNFCYKYSLNSALNFIHFVSHDCAILRSQSFHARQADATIMAGDVTGCNQFEPVCLFFSHLHSNNYADFNYQLAPRHIGRARLRIARA